ncbi:MAG: hypothetical protein D6730_20415 [Bacteroidetes bacterium]|nr:MAG: hypothetical protein D6730_20415 [Bacteroidota bacterium]
MLFVFLIFFTKTFWLKCLYLKCFIYNLLVDTTVGISIMWVIIKAKLLPMLAKSQPILVVNRFKTHYFYEFK